MFLSVFPCFPILYFEACPKLINTLSIKMSSDMMNSFVFLELDEFISHTCGIILTNVALEEYSRKTEAAYKT